MGPMRLQNVRVRFDSWVVRHSFVIQWSRMQHCLCCHAGSNPVETAIRNSAQWWEAGSIPAYSELCQCGDCGQHVPPKTVRTQIDTEHWHHGDELNIVEDPRLKRAAQKGLQVQVHAVSSNLKRKLQGKLQRKSQGRI
jgi:hypothetical protein